MILSVTVSKKHVEDFLKKNYGYNICTVRRFCYNYLGYNKDSLEANIVYYSERIFLRRRVAWRTEEDFNTLYTVIKEILESHNYYNNLKIWYYFERNMLRSAPEMKEKIKNIIYNND